MPVYIALLRGINLGGHKRVAMDKLRAAVEQLGGTGVRTYIQSGNLVFRARKSSPEAWSKKIGSHAAARIWLSGAGDYTNLGGI